MPVSWSSLPASLAAAHTKSALRHSISEPSSRSLGVNAAAFVHQLRVGARRDLAGFIIPVLGFSYLRVHLHLTWSRPALVLGFFWMTAGIIDGAIRTRGFRAELVSFGIPSDVA